MCVYIGVVQQKKRMKSRRQRVTLRKLGVSRAKQNHIVLFF